MKVLAKVIEKNYYINIENNTIILRIENEDIALEPSGINKNNPKHRKFLQIIFPNAIIVENKNDYTNKKNSKLSA